MFQPLDVAFGLDFDVEKDESRRSGFKPAVFDKSGTSLFGDLRLDGWAAMMQHGLASTLLLVGGDESRYPGENLNRGFALKEILVADKGVPNGKVDWFKSVANTQGNIDKIQELIQSQVLDVSRCGIVTNFYHLLRLQHFLDAANLSIRTYPAEAFWLWEDDNGAKFTELTMRLGGNPLAERMASEIKGITAFLQGKYATK